MAGVAMAVVACGGGEDRRPGAEWLALREGDCFSYDHRGVVVESCDSTGWQYRIVRIIEEPRGKACGIDGPQLVPPTNLEDEILICTVGPGTPTP